MTRLNEAVQCFRLALEEHRRNKISDDCARTEENLADALGELGIRTHDQALLRDAIDRLNRLQEYYHNAKQPARLVEIRDIISRREKDLAILNS